MIDYLCLTSGKMTLKETQASPTFAVAGIAVGEKYRAWSLAMIETLRKNGKVLEPVYIFTDSPGHYVGLPNLFTIKIPHSDNAMDIKRWKTQLLDYVPTPNILYIDVDIMVGSGLTPFIRIVFKKLLYHSICVFDHESTGGNCKRPFHMGLFWVNKKNSRLLLQRWEYAFDKGCFAYDQDAFTSIAKPEEINILPGHFLRFPSDEDLLNKRRWPLIHFTFGGRQRFIDAKIIKDYLRNVLGVSDIPPINS